MMARTVLSTAACSAQLRNQKSEPVMDEYPKGYKSY